MYEKNYMTNKRTGILFQLERQEKVTFSCQKFDTIYKIEIPFQFIHTKLLSCLFYQQQNNVCVFSFSL